VVEVDGVRAVPQDLVVAEEVLVDLLGYLFLQYFFPISFMFKWVEVVLVEQIVPPLAVLMLVWMERFLLSILHHQTLSRVFILFVMQIRGLVL
jgi:hypothetical protein